MPRISEFFGIIISMYYKDHNPPHFHIKYGEYEAMINIKDFRLSNGNLPPKALSITIEWASLHQEELMTNWELVSKGKLPNQIDPLK